MLLAIMVDNQVNIKFWASLYKIHPKILFSLTSNRISLFSHIWLVGGEKEKMPKLKVTPMAAIHVGDNFTLFATSMFQQET